MAKFRLVSPKSNLIRSNSGKGCQNLAQYRRIPTVLAGFLSYLPESGTNAQIPVKLTRIWHSTAGILQRLLDSNENFQIPALAGFRLVLPEPGLSKFV